jgi:adenylate kinase
MIKQYVTGRINLLRVSAGALILEAKGTGLNADMLRRFDMDGIVANQELLVAGFRRLREANPHSTIIFDGHNIIDNDEGLVEIAAHVIERLGPAAIIFVTGEPEQIISQRKQDSRRDRPERSLEELAAHQQRALELAQGYAKTIRVPFREIRSGDLNAFTKCVQPIVEGGR